MGVQLIHLVRAFALWLSAGAGHGPDTTIAGAKKYEEFILAPALSPESAPAATPVAEPVETPAAPEPRKGAGRSRKGDTPAGIFG